MLRLGITFTVIACLMAPIVVSSAASGAGLPDMGGLVSTGDKVEVFADRISRDEKTGRVVAEGAVEIRSGRIKLRADRVEMDERTMIVKATGSAVLDSGDSRLQGESLEVDLETELGTIIGGEGFAQEYYFTGERIERIDAERFRLLDGSFTACEGSSPAWSFHSPDTLVHLDHYIYSWYPNLRVKKVPILLIPYAIVPIKPSRATGLLIPRVNYSGRDGIVYGQDLFWALTDSADVTVGFDYYQNRGVRYGLEGNYVIDQGSKGTLTVSHIRDRTLDANPERWDVTYNHQQDLPWGVRGLVEVDYQSDNGYQRDYAVDLEDVAEERLDSALSLTRSFGTVTAALSADWQKSLALEEDGTEKDSSLTRAPELSVKQPDGRLGESPLHYTFGFQGVGLKSVADGVTQETDRFDGSSRVSLPLDVQAWATVTPSLGLEYTYYTRDLEGEAADRFLYNPKLDLVGPRFYRIYGAEGDRARFKHLLYPSVTYSYLPEVDQTSQPQFDGIDRIGAENAVTYRLVNQVLGKFVDPEGKPSLRDVMRLDISQRYDFDAAPGEDGVTRPMGEVSADLDAIPFSWLTLEGNIGYDVNRGDTTTVNYGFEMAKPEVGSLTLRRRHSTGQTVDYLEWGATLNPGAWKLSYRGRYDLAESIFVEQTAEATFTAQCWDATVTYIDREDDYQFRFLLNLKNIGKVVSIR